jgi:hypothetical protein
MPMEGGDVVIIPAVDRPSRRIAERGAGAAPMRKPKASNSGASPPSSHISSKRRGSQQLLVV